MTAKNYQQKFKKINSAYVYLTVITFERKMN